MIDSATEQSTDSNLAGLRLSLSFDLRRIVSTLRSLDGINRNDRIWGLLVGAGGPLFGSLLSFLVWIPFVWNVISTAMGRYPLRIGRAAMACTVVAGLYGMVELGSAIAHSGLASWRFWPNFILFLSPFFFFRRLRLSDTEALLDVFVLGAGFSVIIAAPVAAYEAFWLSNRAEAFCGNPNIFAVMSAVFGSIGALNMMAPCNRRRWLGVLSFFAMLFCVGLSERRALWLAIPVLTAIIIWAVANAVPKRTFRRGAIAIVAFFILAGALGAGQIAQRFGLLSEDLSKIETLGIYDSSTGRRILMLKGGWEAVKEAPIAGYGIVERMNALRAHLPPDTWSLVGYTHPHNGFLAALLDAGVFGLVSLVALLSAPVLIAATAPRDHLWRLRLAVGMILTTCYATSGLFGILFQHDLMDSAFVVTLIIIVASVAEASVRQARE
ncbi:MAG: O-antigen ligase family protein [Oricola sp.]